MKNQVLHSITVVRASRPSNRRLTCDLVARVGGRHDARDVALGHAVLARDLSQDRLRLVDAAGGGQVARRLGHPQPHPEHERAGDRRRGEQERQPSVGTRIQASAAATTVPTPQKLSRITSQRPRLRVGRNSANRLKSSGTAPPRPKPARTRNTHSTHTLGEKADRKPKTAKIPIVIVKPRLRPMRSDDGAPEPGAAEHADEGRGDDDRALERAEPEVLGDHRQREGDEEDLGRVGGPGHPADAEQALLEPTEPDPVDGGLHRDGSRVGRHVLPPCVERRLPERRVRVRSFPERTARTKDFVAIGLKAAPMA